MLNLYPRSNSAISFLRALASNLYLVRKSWANDVIVGTISLQKTMNIDTEKEDDDIIKELEAQLQMAVESEDFDAAGILSTQ